MSVCTTIQQQVYCLAIEICAAATQTGDAATLATYLQGELQALITNPDFTNGDDWQIVWGPAMWQAPFSDFSDQAAAVCYNSSQNVYVVPVSATNPHSPYNVFFEDLAAVPLYMVPVPGTNAGNVTVGNFAGLQALLGLQAGGTSLQDFLSGTANASDDLVFCGHSLGGGLTPLLAYTLYPNGTSGSGWQNVYTFPTAGPTTADAAFATAFNAAYPVVSGSGYQMWNANQYNAHDLVPNAWAGASTGPGLAQVTTGIFSWTTAMYYTGVKMSGEVAALRTMAETFAGGSSNPYVATNNNALFTGARQYGQITDSATLAKEILFQHTVAYNEEFGVTALFDPAEVQSWIQPPLLPLVLGVSGVGEAVAAATAAAAAEQEAAPA
ncbi:hypothetical protein PIB19_14120 [Sphingomonas sp. 7/4-4]|uniref:lipase family protein n=1 Tax=Sphingomonas sp. 7/4-4 TaxID=3018446 RepID=UPI0022F3B2A0|nr:hypothetical protein [Sphingomonas sp. 7/4-4]WBY06676.1 hypothetical protein PIB19_14120 [Sphingomonas sp. 7/4-4]